MGKGKIIICGIAGMPSAKVEIDVNELKELRSNDNRGYATFNLNLDNGKTLAFKNEETGNVIIPSILLLDKDKKSKGEGKSEVELV